MTLADAVGGLTASPNPLLPAPHIAHEPTMHPLIKRIIIWLLILATLLLLWKFVVSSMERSRKHDAAASERTLDTTHPPAS